MMVIRQIAETRHAVRNLQESDQTVGLVPTMGALHDGHLSLIRTARAQCAAVAVSIFVNPLQFGPNEDLDAYPRTTEEDLAICKEAGVSLVFAPTVGTMYPEKSATKVHLDDLTSGLCGPHRPGHFDGVATVVAKLFQILPADRAYFGEKDYQQLVIIQRMVADLNIPIEVFGCPTIRESDGLAMSSRNRYLSAEDRVQAVSINRALFAAVDQAQAGEINTTSIVSAVRDTIRDSGPCTIEYVELVDAESLGPVGQIDRSCRLCVAVRIGGCRLIDNIEIPPPAQGNLGSSF